MARYYACWYEPDEVSCAEPRNGWYVFDRERFDNEGRLVPIALCVTRNVAFNIRDALNADEERLK